MEAKVEEKEALADEKEGYGIEDKGSCAPSVVRITRVDVDAGPSPLQSALDLAVDFFTDDDLQDAVWHLKYLVDSVYTRHIIRKCIVCEVYCECLVSLLTRDISLPCPTALASTEPQIFEAGDCQFSFSIPEIDVSEVKPSALSNAGLLIATLQSGDCELLDLSMVVQVQPQDGELYRVIYNPLQ